MAHAASHIKKARSEMDQPPDLKALEKARERRKRSRERAERKRKVEADSRITPDSPFIPLPVIHRPSSSDCPFTMQTCSSESVKDREELSCSWSQTVLISAFISACILI
ncbi:hypothetical protein KUCAC02_000533 [Chaenocephalus aceratus]|uniref:Uncharacterized protein n=1 Tax=Chaenocephalus aceratus TaxID=36190 RepID=A0ACB9W6P2_CHAAC|nr:hypothetical protein KUCAC02_000533 [Chaenocephalus aceratus]